MQVGATTKFKEIHQQTKAQGQFANVPGAKHLRLSPTGDLHTHRTDKSSGIHFLDRAEKHKQAVVAIKSAIDAEAGPGVGDRVFERLGLGNKVKVSDLDAINQDIVGAQKAALSEMLHPVTAKAGDIAEDLGKLGKEVLERALAGNGNLRAADQAELRGLLRFSPQELESTTAKSRQLIRAVLTLFVANGGDMKTAHILKDHLRANSSDKDVRALLDALKVQPTPNAGVDRTALRRDLGGGELGMLQTLAKHGLVAANQTPNKTSLHVMIASGPDRTAFTYNKLVGPKEILGSQVSMRLDGDFRVLESHDMDESLKTRDKVHLSVDPKHAGRAWDVVLPILLKHGDTIKQFKITDMDRAETAIGKASKAKSPADLEAARRVYNGAQITIYQHAPGKDIEAESQAFARVMTEIEAALRKDGIGPGDRPDSDLMIPGNNYASFRREVRGDGSSLRPTDPDYASQKKLMRDRPLYQALIG